MSVRPTERRRGDPRRPRRPAGARAGRAVPARPDVRRAVPPRRRQGRAPLRLPPLRQPDVDALRGGADASSSAAPPSCSRPGMAAVSVGAARAARARRRARRAVGRLPGRARRRRVAPRAAGHRGPARARPTRRRSARRIARRRRSSGSRCRRTPSSPCSTSPRSPTTSTPPARCSPSTTRSPRRSPSGRSSSAPTSRCRARRRRSPATRTSCSATSRSATPRSPSALAAWRGRNGAIAGPFEVWLAHRSLATLDVRLRAPVRERARARRGARGRRARAAASATRACPSHPGHEVAARQMDGLFGMVLGFELADADAAQAFLGGVRAGRRGDELRRHPHDRRAPRAVGHRRGLGGLHPAQRGARGRRRPARRCPPCVGRRLILWDDLKIILRAVSARDVPLMCWRAIDLASTSSPPGAPPRSPSRWRWRASAGSAPRRAPPPESRVRRHRRRPSSSPPARRSGAGLAKLTLDRTGKGETGLVLVQPERRA